jgi:perosamine synthetase
MSEAANRFIPLSAPVLAGNEARYAQECVASGWVSSAGPWVDRFEKEFAARVGAPSAVSVTSGTAALHLALILSGVHPGDEVLVPTLTFIAPVNAVRYLQAIPVFMDCDAWLNMDPRKIAEYLETECAFDGEITRNRKSGRVVRAIVPVHVFGHPADVVRLTELARRYRLTLIEDATESLGSLVHQPDGTRRPTGSFGELGCFSFNGNKIITTGGGGMMIGRDPAALKRAKYLSTQAKDDEVFFLHGDVGFNYRMTSVQAAIGIAQLEQLDPFIAARQLNFATYRRLAESTGLAEHATFIAEPPGTTSNYWLTTLEFRESARVDLHALIAHLGKDHIQARPVWGLNHLQKPYVDFPSFRIEEATRRLPRLLNLPSSADLTEAELARVIDSLLRYLRG